MSPPDSSSEMPGFSLSFHMLMCTQRCRNELTGDSDTPYTCVLLLKAKPSGKAVLCQQVPPQTNPFWATSHMQHCHWPTVAAELWSPAVGRIECCREEIKASWHIPHKVAWNKISAQVGSLQFNKDRHPLDYLHSQTLAICCLVHYESCFRKFSYTRLSIWRDKASTTTLKACLTMPGHLAWHVIPLCDVDIYHS